MAERRRQWRAPCDHLRVWEFPFDVSIWGTVAEWFAAVGTVAAFGAGIIVIKRDNEWKHAEEKRRKEELERQQAELITGWWDDETDEIELINSSTGIVYLVILTTVYGLRPGHPNSVLGDATGETKALSVLPPGKRRVPIRRQYRDDELVSRRLSIRFSDAAGRHWIRGGRGDLDRTDEDPGTFLREQLLRRQKLLSEMQNDDPPSERT